MINHPIITKNSPLELFTRAPTTKISKGDVFSLRSIHVPANLGAILEKSILPRKICQFIPGKIINLKRNRILLR